MEAGQRRMLRKWGGVGAGLLLLQIVKDRKKEESSARGWGADLTHGIFKIPANQRLPSRLFEEAVQHRGNDMQLEPKWSVRDGSFQGVCACVLCVPFTVKLLAQPH